jgi:hypothetical protein
MLYKLQLMYIKQRRYIKVGITILENQTRPWVRTSSLNWRPEGAVLKNVFLNLNLMPYEDDLRGWRNANGGTVPCSSSH